MTRRALRAKRRNTRRVHTHKRRKTNGGAVYDPMKYDTFTVRYFQNLDLPPLVQENLMGRLNLQLAPLSKAVQAALDITQAQMEACKARNGTSIEAQDIEWKKCEGKCYTLITDAVNQEIESTAFMLKLLADSVIRPDGKQHRLKIGLDESFFTRSDKPGGDEKAKDDTNKGNKAGCRLLTGRWREDAPFLRLVLPRSKGPKPFLGLRPSGRLVMGFGPSASGKTYWAKTILSLLAQADPLFPEVFFAVDGGLVRESSAVYQFATEMAHCAGFAGFKNLHAGMFVTGDIKHSMEEYLLAESQRSPISLYVPETLGKCEFLVAGVTVPLIRHCDEYLKTFLDITRDEQWIGLLIWQHATAADHGKQDMFIKTFPGDMYQCAGCMESGKKREKSEGKPYEGHVYKQSLRNGLKYMGLVPGGYMIEMKNRSMNGSANREAHVGLAPGGRYVIHNAGRPDGTSILWDYSAKAVDQSERGKTADRFSEIMKASAEKYKIRYVDHRSKGIPTVAERNALAAASTWKSVLELPNTATKEEVEKAVEKVEATSTSTFEERQARRDAAASDVGSVLGNVARGVRIPGTPNARAIKIRESSYSSNNMQKAEKAKSNAKFATRKKAAEVERSNPSFLRKVAALRSAQRNAEEGTPEAAAKRLAALRMPTKAQQEEYATVAKRLTAERQAAEKAMAEKAKRNAAMQRNAAAAAASYVSPEKVASRAEKEKINRYSYSGNVGNLSHESMIGNVIDL